MQQIRRRLSYLFFIFSGLYAIFLIHLYCLQIVQADFYQDIAKKQYLTTVELRPERGSIEDRHGMPIAVNRESLAAFIMPKKLEDKPQLERFLAMHFPEAKKRLERYANKHFMYVARQITDEFCHKVRCGQVKDLQFLHEPSRFYLYRSLGQIVGGTDIDNKGLFGIERQCDQLLAGEPVVCELLRDARNGLYYFDRKVEHLGKKSLPVRLTVDAELQELVAECVQEHVERLEAQQGAALILDPYSGDVISAVGCPNFDPNMPVDEVEQTKLFPVTESHELGSVMKVFVALAALSEGVVDLDTLIDCEGKKETALHGMKFSTVLVDETIPFIDVVARSNNIGMAKVADQLGEAVYAHYTKLGFGKKTGSNFDGEQSGYVSHPAQWSKRSLISLSFGYEITATLLQLARAMALIANGGHLVRPRFLLSQPVEMSQQLYDAVVLDKLRCILRRTVQAGTGMRANIMGYDVLGKTGTAQLVVNGAYSPEHHIYTFAGIVQKEQYQRVIVTCIKNAKNPQLYASTTAAPLFVAIAKKMLIHDRAV